MSHKQPAANAVHAGISWPAETEKRTLLDPSIVCARGPIRKASGPRCGGCQLTVGLVPLGTNFREKKRTDYEQEAVKKCFYKKGIKIQSSIFEENRFRLFKFGGLIKFQIPVLA
ncbi:hypothetical protein CEXT_393351 [Caerostris extrusa]|uniref:Uncharacterized protein n=1 Tax=Caerostris extrusa TaxID=172846 RepID=A0AAV4NW31_CAEEX|nr:hypothetical protein CEXT_393351 [Caerostris extrusa]